MLSKYMELLVGNNLTENPRMIYRLVSYITTIKTILKYLNNMRQKVLQNFLSGIELSSH